MNKNDIITLKIEDMGIDGEGIGKIDGMTFFVKDAVIGDEIEARITKLKKNYGYARVEQILKSSEFRTEPKCELHRRCGGCQIQAMDYAKQLEFKENKVKNNLVRLGGFDADFVDSVTEPIVGMEEPYRYRNKAQFPIGKDKDGNIIAGFYASRTHSIIPVNSLSPMYNVQACGNGKEALIIAKEFWPELILSDIMMPEMRGDELCIAIKNDIETSHIPVLLLTALGEEQNILDGLHIGADEYIIKPFSVRILKASVANLLANRALLRSRYANLEIEDTKVMTPLANGMNSLDWKFISDVKKSIEDNIDNAAFSVEVLNDLHGMSRTSFYCKLKALTDLSPQELIKSVRLKRAVQLLKEGKHNITEVSELCGFSESKYFRQVFKKEYKMSPSQYAKEYGTSSAIIEDDTSQDDSDK